MVHNDISFQMHSLHTEFPFKSAITIVVAYFLNKKKKKKIQEDKATYFIWIIYLAQNSLQMSSLMFLET